MLHALSWIVNYMDNVKKEQVMTALFLSNFRHCPLSFCERNINNKIKQLHEKALRIAYKDDFTDFVTLLEKDIKILTAAHG